MKFFITLLVFWQSLLCAQPIENSTWGIQLTQGIGNFSGDLSKDSSSSVQSFQILTSFIYSTRYSIESHLIIDTILTKMTHSGSEFPFSESSKLKLLSFLFIPTVCNLRKSEFQYCFGIGQGTVNINGSGNRRDYGTWNYQGSIKYFVSNNWNLVLMQKYIGKIEQEVNGRSSEFGLYITSFGVSYLY